MLSLTKSLVLLLLASGIQVVRSESCEDTNNAEGEGNGCKNEGCSTDTFPTGETFSIDSSTNDPKCGDAQYAYVTGITIASTDTTSRFSYTTTPELSSNDASCTQTNESCRNDGSLTCGKGATNEDSVVSVTCDTDECNIKYYVTWACNNATNPDATSTATTSTTTTTATTTTATTAPTTAPSTTTSNSTTNSTTTVPNSAWVETGAGLAGLAAAAIAALLQL